MSLPDSSAQLAVSEDKRIDARDAEAVVHLIANDKARDIMTRKAFENAITVVITLGGSTTLCSICLPWPMPPRSLLVSTISPKSASESPCFAT